MTCEEIAEQIAELLTQVGQCQSDVDMQRSTINSMYDMALMPDSYGGTYPATPIQAAGLTTRIAYLNGLSPVPTGLVGSYNDILAMLVVLDGYQATLTQKIAQLGEMRQQGIDQNCGF